MALARGSRNAQQTSPPDRPRRGAMSVRLIMAGLAFVLLPVHVEASTLSMSDAQSVHALRIQLRATTADIAEAMKQARATNNDRVVECLNYMHNYGSSIESTLAGVDDLTALSLLMKDSADETNVLKELLTWLVMLTDYFTSARQMINGFMIACPSSAAVSVKGQTLLNLLANWRDPVDSILERVWQGTQWSFFPGAVRR
jgi:hypothetical protein